MTDPPQTPCSREPNKCYAHDNDTGCWHLAQQPNAMFFRNFGLAFKPWSHRGSVKTSSLVVPSVRTHAKVAGLVWHRMTVYILNTAQLFMQDRQLAAMLLAVVHLNKQYRCSLTYSWDISPIIHSNPWTRTLLFTWRSSQEQDRGDDLIGWPRLRGYRPKG